MNTQAGSSIAWIYAVLAAILLSSLGLVAYHNSLEAPFIHDDEPAITNNPRIRALWPFGAENYAVQSTERGRPVVRLSLAINYALGELELGDHGVLNGAARSLGIGLGGTNVRGYHVFNLAVHILSSLVLFSIIWRTLRLSNEASSRFYGAARLLALIAAAIWLVHPLQTDAVTYVIQRTELLMGLFYLLTLLTAIMALDSRAPWAWSIASVLCCALGMGSKEVMVSAPIMVVLYDRVFAFSSWREALTRRWYLYAGLACTWPILVALITSGPRNKTVGFDLGVAWWQYGATQLGMVLNYLRLAFWPDTLCLDYGHILADTSGEIVPGALVIGLLAAATAWALFRRPALGFVGAWFFMILAPSSSFVPIVTEVGAERRMYLPLAAVVVLVVLGAYWLAAFVLHWFGYTKHDRLAWVAPFVAVAGAAIAVLVVSCALTVRRNADYQSDLSIWLDTVRKRPDNAAARNNLGRAYARRLRFAEAREQFSAATRLPFSPVDAFNNLGKALSDLGRLDESAVYFRNLLRDHPNNWQAHNGLGEVLIRQEKWVEAIAEFQACLGFGYRSADTHNNLGMALCKVGRIEEAVQEFNKALEIDPTHATAASNLIKANDFLKKDALQRR